MQREREGCHRSDVVDYSTPHGPVIIARESDEPFGPASPRFIEALCGTVETVKLCDSAADPIMPPCVARQAVLAAMHVVELEDHKLCSRLVMGMMTTERYREREEAKQLTADTRFVQQVRVQLCVCVCVSVSVCVCVCVQTMD